jgi:hypothetical protein
MRRAATTLLLLAACGDAGAGDETAAPGSSSGETTGAATSGETTADEPTTGETGEAASGESSTGAPEELLPDPGEPRYALVGEAVVLDGSASTGAALYRWDPGDGSPAGEPSSSPVLAVSYAAPGRYKPILTVYDAMGGQLAASVTITVTDPPVWQPRHSSTVVRVGARVAVVSPDSDEVMIAAGDERGFTVERRLATAAHPRTLAALDDVWLAVAAQDAATLQFLRADGDGEVSVALPPASRPYGVVAAGEDVFVSLQATGQLARVDFAGGKPVLKDIWDVGPDARGVALLPDGRVAVSRWRSRPGGGEVWAVDPGTGEVETWALAFDPQAASDTEVGGVPSYLGPLALSPTGKQAALAGLQANIGEGAYNAGVPLAADTVLRAILAYVDPAGGGEDFAARKQFDNRGMASAATFSRFGDYVYVATRGPRTIERVDVFSGDVSGNIFDVGLALEGLALSADDRFLFVDAYMSRELVVHDARAVEAPMPPLARLQIPTSEPLAPAVLRGKQLFNDSADPRLSKDMYVACAHCHLEGESDLQVWDFTDRGEGLRDTHALTGRAGAGDGPIHWTANFDEVQDFENDIRGHFGGSGLMADADWRSGTRSQTLGDPKAGVSADLDALAAYVSSLTAEPRSPHRTPEGELTPAAEAGKALFESPALGCGECHTGPRLTDSQFVDPGVPLLHDVGTLGPGSGQRLGQPLTGLDTPTLHGLWRTAPYLHDGSAATLEDVLVARNPDDLHGVTSMLDAAERAALVAYLLCLDGAAD